MSYDPNQQLPYDLAEAPTMELPVIDGDMPAPHPLDAPTIEIDQDYLRLRYGVDDTQPTPADITANAGVWRISADARARAAEVTQAAKEKILNPDIHDVAKAAGHAALGAAGIGSREDGGYGVVDKTDAARAVLVAKVHPLGLLGDAAARAANGAVDEMKNRGLAPRTTGAVDRVRDAQESHPHLARAAKWAGRVALGRFRERRQQ